MADINDARLDRIETKLDKMAEALIVLVCIEERTSTLFKRLDASDARMNGISTRVTHLEKTSDRRGVTFGRSTSCSGSPSPQPLASAPGG